LYAIRFVEENDYIIIPNMVSIVAAQGSSQKPTPYIQLPRFSRIFHSLSGIHPKLGPQYMIDSCYDDKSEGPNIKPT
jgi:hypothetical protein